jgi:DNA-binding GntR family transcriptional regulator
MAPQKDALPAVGALTGIGRSIPLRERVADSLRDAIVNMHFLPGQLLVEGQLCEELSISRASLRQALRVLEAEGLVEARNGRGILVSVLDPKTALDLYAVRASLESTLAHIFVTQASDDEMAELTRRLEAIEAAHGLSTANNELIRLIEYFYDHMLACVDNEPLERFLRIIYRRIPQLRASTVNFPGRATEALSEYQKFREVASARDADAAAATLEEHVQNAALVVKQVLAEQIH